MHNSLKTHLNNRQSIRFSLNSTQGIAHGLGKRLQLGACACSLLVAAGTSVGQADGTSDQTPTQTISATELALLGSPVVFQASQLQSLSQAFQWFERDASILRSTITPRVVFTPAPRVKERTEFLNVQVKNHDEMMKQVAREYAAELQASPRAQTIGVDHASATPAAIQSLLDARVELAHKRIEEARARVAPSTRRAYMDVDMHSIRVPAGVSPEATAEALMMTGDYEFVSMDWLCYPQATTPNDPLFSTQWHHNANRIDSVGAWDYLQGSSNTIVGVVDSGVDLDHPDLAASLVPGYNAVNDLAQVNGGNVDDHVVGHGTQVAGSTAAIGNNGSGVSGVGWNFGIMPVKVSNNSSGTAFLSHILGGARWASDNGAYVANCSFGGAEDPATWSAGGHIRQEGHLLVFAAGNFGLADQVNDWTTVTIVGASTNTDNWATWSHTGVGIDCIAPGANIRTTNRTGGYSYATGTSFAAPITAGALMLVHEANPSLTADEVESTLFNACDDKQAQGEDDQTGWGRINVRRAVEDAMFGPSITALPFFEDFPTDELPTAWRNPVGDVDVSMNGANPPSGLYSLNLDNDDSIETIKLRAEFLGGQVGEISFYTQHRGPEAGETLTVEYFSLLNSWQPVAMITSDGSVQDEFTQYRVPLPALGSHDDLKLRFVANGSDSGDDWYIDDVRVQEFENNIVPWTDTFEDGITLTLDWASSQAQASTAASNEPSGNQSALLTNQQSMTSAEADLNTAKSVVYVHFYAQHHGVETGESLLVEYLTSLGTWNTLTTVTSDGTDPNNFELVQLPIPFDAYGGNSALRFTAQGNEANDQWFIDNVSITTEIIEETDCPADLTDDGDLNFFDVSAFLSAFNSQDPVADFTDDGLFNFFDVSAFLSAFNAGCP